MLNINKAMNARIVEPQKRLKGNPFPEWVVHRFPIKGGISLRDVWLMDMARPNPLLKLLQEGNQNAIGTESN